MEEKDILEMRQQLASLREMLNDQQIVSDRLVRESMRTKTSDIKRTERFSYAAAIFCLVIYPVIASTGMFSIVFCIATCLMMLFCIGATIYIHRPVNRTDLMTADMATVAAVMRRFNKQNDIWLRYFTPALIVPWLSWVSYEFVQRNKPDGVNPFLLVLPLLIGAAIGGWIGYRKTRQATNAADDILHQIEN